MKKPYDFLFTDKIPFLVFTKCKIFMKDGFLVAANKDGVKTISPSNLAMIFIDVGTSITHDAINELTKHDCLICFTNGGFNIHSVFKEQRFTDPTYLVNQVLLTQNEENKLKIAKDLFKIRLHLTNNFNKTIKLDFDVGEAFVKIENSPDEKKLLGYEGNFVRYLYKEYSKKFNIENFKREKDFDQKIKTTSNFSKENINERLNKLNNTMYNFCSAICLSFGLSPSIAFLHGETRRGGLAFDLADIVKPLLILDICFDKNVEERKIYFHLKNKLVENNYFYTKLLFFICKNIGDRKTNLYNEYLKYIKENKN